MRGSSEGDARPPATKLKSGGRNPGDAPRRGELTRAAAQVLTAQHVYEPASMFKVDAAARVRALVEPFPQM